ncbi:MAG: S24/S26 family peptidase [Bacteroidales bacterium]|nr:S24/S26 family peptidase [Bacteroidales bacterium]
MRENGRPEGKIVDMDLFMGGIGEFLGEGKEVVMTPKGNSMLPFIKGDRDSVVLTKPSKPFEVGNIVLAKVGQRYIMHRIFAVEGDSLTLMGDGNVCGTESCHTSDVIGLVTEIRKENGKIVKPGKGALWRSLRPIRRYILAIYKRVIL